MMKCVICKFPANDQNCIMIAIKSKSWGDGFICSKECARSKLLIEALERIEESRRQSNLAKDDY